MTTHLELPEGDFFVSCYSDTQYLDAPSSQTGASLHTSNWSGSPSQQWRIRQRDSGAYVIQNKQNGGYVGRTPNGDDEASAQSIQLLYEENQSGTWYIRPATNSGLENGYLICADPRISECLIHAGGPEDLVMAHPNELTSPVWVLNATSTMPPFGPPEHQGLSTDGKAGLVGSFVGAAVGAALAYALDKTCNGGNLKTKSIKWIKRRWDGIVWDPKKWKVFR
ncbi:hypothetical protein CPB83DRAFT_896504 [Crepidotus variabilis]|uniref:Ricin B lectin domain-containing protein n=1 Tax=Crepidotus variabilis TaxID=179855 RepID=A0A9P6EC23_9AGAR|nr:hypothetical protein CPB83DRAFT_896504 [Crepidotus variabilis]